MIEGNDGADNAAQLTAEVLQQADNGLSKETEEIVEELKGASDTEETVEEKQEVEEQKEEKSPEDKTFAAKFAALTRKEKEIREREKHVEGRLAELEAKMSELNKPEVVEEEEPLEMLMRKNPLEGLKKFDLDYETLTQIALNDGKLPVELQLKLAQQQLDAKYSGELEKLRNELAEKDKKSEEVRHKQVIEGFKNQINEEIVSNPSEYELLNANREDNIELVYEVIEEHYNQTESVMDVKMAANLVEEHLLEEAKKYLEKSKIQKLMGASEKTQEVKPKETKSQESVTLSNSQSQISNAGERWLSDEESKREAAKLIRWTEE